MTNREKAEQLFSAEKSFLSQVYYEGLVRAAEQRLEREQQAKSAAT